MPGWDAQRDARPAARAAPAPPPVPPATLQASSPCCLSAALQVFGLGHCRNPSCVMWFSNTLEETDRKGWRPCEHCAARLAAALLGAGGG